MSPLFLPNDPHNVITPCVFVKSAVPINPRMARLMSEKGNQSTDSERRFKPSDEYANNIGRTVSKAIFFGQLIGSMKDVLKIMVEIINGKKNLKDIFNELSLIIEGYHLSTC